jgi:hypothetical protein
MKSGHTPTRQRGQGLVEFALIAPVMLFVVMGVMDFGRAMIVYSQGSNALRNAARYAEVWGGQAADNHQYLDCGDGEAIKGLAGQVMFASVNTDIIFVKKGYYDQGNDFLDDGEFTITCAEAKANPDALQTGDLMIIRSTGSFNTITPLISNILPRADFQFRAQRTIIANLNVGETTSTSGNGIVNCSFQAAQPEVSVRASRPTSVPEGGSAIFTFSLCQSATQTVTANYTVSGTATAGSDYTGITTGTVTFTPGQQVVNIPVSILTDDILESVSETIVVTLTSATNAALGMPTTATVQIMNDNASGLCSQLEVHVGYLSWGALRFKIVNVGGNDYDYSTLRLFYYFTRTTTGGVGAASSRQSGDNVDLGLVTNPATMISGNNGVMEIRVTNSGTLRGNSNDYISGTLQYYEGHNYNLNTTNLNDDFSAEGVPTNGNPVLVQKVPLTVNGTVVCGAHPDGSSPGGGSASPPTVSISPGSTSTAEGSTANLTVSLSAATTNPVTVSYTFSGNASSSDYSPNVPGTVTIPAGQTSVPLNIAITDDTNEEQVETVTVSLASVTTGNATLHFSNNQSVITIPANDAVMVSVSPATVSVAEGSSTNLTFSLSGTALSHVAFTYTVSGTASSSDYTLSNTTGTVTIPMGQTTATLTVNAVNDSDPENDETVIVTLGSVTSLNASINQSSKVSTVTIPMNDQAPSVTVSASPTSVNENGTVRFTATLSQVQAQAVSVAYSTSNGTATAGSDFPSTSGTFTFAPNELTKYVDVAITDDTLVEGNETFSFALSSPNGVTLGSPSSVTVTIVDNDVPAITIDDLSVAENVGNAVVTVRVSPVSNQELRVQYSTANNTATAGSDYTATSGTVIIPAGAPTATISIPITNDTLDEAAETFYVNLGTVTQGTANVTDSQAVVTIQTDSNDPQPQITIDDVTVNESDGSAVFNVRLSVASGRSVTVYFATADNTATKPSDYTETVRQLTFAPGELTKTVSVPIIDDTATENDETFYGDLSQATNASISRARATATIRANDAVASYVLNLTTPNNPVTEPATGTAQITFTVSIGQPNPGPDTFNVNYSVSSQSGDTAISYNNKDFDQKSGTVTIPPGQTTGTFTVTIYGDNYDEADEETFTVSLGESWGKNFTLQNGVTSIRMRILDEDPMPVLSVSNTAANWNQNGQVPITMTGASERPITVSFTYSNGSSSGSGTAAVYGTHFSIGTSSPITLEAWNRFINFSSPYQSSAPTRYFHVTLTSATNATIGTATANVKICATGTSSCTYTAP